MNFNEVKELIQLVNDSEISYFEVKNENNYIKMDKSLNRNSENKIVDIETKSKIEEKSEEIIKVKDSNIINEEEFEYIKAPMVGTFYKAISPEEKPFVTKNQKVSKGQVLCIVEAMKLMNEIVAEFDCEILDIMVEDSQMVEYSQPIFKIRR